MYGLPAFDPESSGQLDVVLGGCMMSNLAPTHWCRSCDRGFGGPRDSMAAELGEETVTREQLQSADCWFPTTDKAPGDPLTSEFKRLARYHQAKWREQRGYPIGTQPIVAKSTSPGKPVGSRLQWEYATVSGANLLSDAARQAARERLGRAEQHQTLNPQRLWADLLSSMPMCWNLFGPLAVDADLAAAAVAEWFPEATGLPSTVRLEWSPGRCDPEFLNNRTAFDAAIEVDRGAAGFGIIGIETKYHEHAKPEKPPSPERLRRYVDVTRRSGVFVAEAVDRIVGTDLQQVWLDHLLALSMLQHRSGRWTWARYVVVHPARNPSFAGVADRYRNLLVDDATFEVRTLESFLDIGGPLPAELRDPIAERYLW